MKTIKNLQNLIKLIKKVHTQSKINKYNIYTNLRYMDKESARIYNILNLINKYKAEFFIKLMEIFIKNRNFKVLIINLIYQIFSFIKELIIYLIGKYYYKYNFLYFSLKASQNVDTLKFFITLDKIKSFLNFTKEQDKISVYLFFCHYVFIMLIFFYVPYSFNMIDILRRKGHYQSWLGRRPEIKYN